MHSERDSFLLMKGTVVTFEVGMVVHDKCTFLAIGAWSCYCPSVQITYVDFSLESTLHTYSQRKRTIRGQNVYADKLATGKW